MTIPNLNAPVETKTTVDDIIDLFNADEPKVEETKEKEEQTPVIDLLGGEEEETKEEEPKEEIKLNADTDEEPEIEEDDVLPALNRKEVLKKYPNIFKEYPALEKSLYISREYEGVVGTIKDAKELVARSQEYKEVEESLLDGNVDGILAGVANVNPKAFAKIVDNYLPQLAKVNPNAYYHVIGNVSKDIITALARAAQQDGNDTLREAALILNKFIFNSTEFVPSQKFAPKDEQIDPEKQQLLQEKQRIVQEKFDTAINEVTASADKIVRANINQHIDPKGVMTDYVKRQAIRDTAEYIETTVNNDSQFKKTINRLWEKAASENFSKSSLEKIEKAYLSKVAVIFPDAIKKSRNEALKGLGKRVDNESGNRRITGPAGKVSDTKKDDKEIPKGMKTVDYFLQD